MAWRPLTSKGRAQILAALAMAWTCAVAGRLVQLQIVEHGKYRRQAESQALRDVELPARRGGIYDRNGRPLALSIPVDSVAVNPRQAPDPSVAAGILAPILGLDPKALEAKLAAAGASRRGFLWVQRRISFEQSERLRKLKLGWIQLLPDSMRVYPKGSLAAHVLGSVDHQERGDFGIEKALEGELAGRPGRAQVMSDVVKRAVESRIQDAPEPGKDLTLTIDERLQYAAEQELAKAVTARGGQSGSVVVLNPENGDVLALASYPPFDPNKAVKSEEELKARMNHAVSAPFEPGSVFKVVTLTAALETTSLRPETVVPCGNGSINLFGRIIRDHKAYSSLSMADVLAKSSNIGTIQIGLKVGARNLLDYVRRFGFGRPTGLPLPAESGGRVWDLPAWGKTSIGSVAMGHEISTTTIQLAQAIAVLANGGRLVRPRLIAMRQRPGEPAVEEPVPAAAQVIRPETAITMRQMMEGVVLHGTGTLARVGGYTSGGKTGSAQIYDSACRCYRHYYNSSFAGFAPVTRPAVVVVVTVNGAPVFGGAIAAPAFRQVTATALRLLSIPKDLPDAPPPREEKPAAYSDLAIADLGPPVPALPEPGGPADPGPVQLLGPAVPDFHGKTVRKVLEESAEMGLPVEVFGSGLARSQNPQPGGILPHGERVRIQFAR